MNLLEDPEYREAAALCACSHTRFIHAETTGKCVRRSCGCARMRPTGQVAR